MKNKLLDMWADAMEDGESFAALLMNLYIGGCLIIGVSAMAYAFYTAAAGVPI